MFRRLKVLSPKPVMLMPGAVYMYQGSVTFGMQYGPTKKNGPTVSCHNLLYQYVTFASICIKNNLLYQYITYGM